MGMKIYTKNLAAGQSLTITHDQGIYFISFKMSGETGDNGTFEGDQAFPLTGDPSEPLVLNEFEGNTITSSANQKPIDGLTLHCNQGTMKVMCGF